MSHVGYLLIQDDVKQLLALRDRVTRFQEAVAANPENSALASALQEAQRDFEGLRKYALFVERHRLPAEPGVAARIVSLVGR